MGLLNVHLDNYLTETPEKNLDVINDLFRNEFSDVDMVIISSQQGCGGTHLLQLIGKQLIKENKSVCCVSGENLVRIFLSEKEALEQYLKQQSYFLIDDLYYLKHHLDCFGWLKLFLKPFILNGGRFIFTNTDTNLSADDWLKEIGKYKTTEITSTYPSVEILRCIAEQQLSSWLVSKHFEEVYRRSNCTREFLGLLISYEAKYKLGLPI